MSWLSNLGRWIWDIRKEKRRRDEREQDRSENFALDLEMKPRDGNFQVTAKVVNHGLFPIDIERVVFYCPPEQEITMKHRDSRSGEVKSKAGLSFHYLTWDPGSAAAVQPIPPNELKIEARTATGASQTINGVQIKAAAFDCSH